MINSAQTFGGFFNPVPVMNGYGYVQQPRTLDKSQMRNVISAEEQERLRKNKQEFSGKLTDEEYLRALCTHKDVRTGNISLNHNDDGSVTCAICGENFRIVDTSEGEITMEDIEATCSNFNDIFQTIKLIYGAIPEDVGRQLYVVAGFIKKVPMFYKYAKTWFEQIGKAGQGFTAFNNDPNYTMFRTLFHSPNPMMQASIDPRYGNQLNGWMMNGLQSQAAVQTSAIQRYDQFGRAVDQYGNLIVDQNGNFIMNTGANAGQQQAQVLYDANGNPVTTVPAAGTTVAATGTPVVPVTPVPSVGAAPAINYGAPVAGNAVGIVTPDPTVGKTVGVAAPGATPEVTTAFKY